MIKKFLYATALLLTFIILSSCSNRNSSSSETDNDSYAIEFKMVGVEKDEMLTIKEDDYVMRFKNDGEGYKMEIPLTLIVSDESINNKIKCTHLSFNLTNENGMSVDGAGVDLSNGDESAKTLFNTLNQGIESGKKEINLTVTKVYDEEVVEAIKHWGLSRISLTFEIESQQSGKKVIGSNGSYDLDYLITEAHKKGFSDGYKGVSGWDAVASFDRWLDRLLGIPQNTAQKESRKEYREQIWDSYNSGLHEGWEP